MNKNMHEKSILLRLTPLRCICNHFSESLPTRCITENSIANRTFVYYMAP